MADVIRMKKPVWRCTGCKEKFGTRVAMETHKVDCARVALNDIKKTVVENYGWAPVFEGDGCVEEIKRILKRMGL